ncbi:helix-turn-helix domain-containing protein [Sphingobacterium detergens]|uniref:helix-turn-helix domain-containing protein n=1 Tax=Sphingobacterium detergens TaxID=1145106 RepID=UPI003AAEA2A4
MSIEKLDKDRLYKIIGERLREARLAKGLKAPEVAEMIGLQKTAFYMFERGLNMPKLWVLIQLCVIYGVNPSYILLFDELPNLSHKQLANLLNK